MAMTFLLEYANAAFFQRMLAEGFDAVACGCERAYTQNTRFAAIFAFYKPAGATHAMDCVQVPTWQVVKERSLGRGEADYKEPCETRYSEKAFAQFLSQRRIVMGARQSLSEVVRAIDAAPQDARDGVLA
jgi:hypothetical protein